MEINYQKCFSPKGTLINGLLTLIPKINLDKRGFFQESWNKKDFNEVLSKNDQKEEFFVPKVGILTYFVKAPFARRVALNRENIFIRDFFTCQYCGKSAESVDHIIPRSKGGLHEWSNVVACCKKCNLIKADKLLHQTHLNLKNSPSNPKDNFWIKTIVGSNPDPSWKEYLISA